MIYAFLALNAVAWILAVARMSKLTVAARHHEHVMRLTLETLSRPCPYPMTAHAFALMVLNEEPWDETSRLSGSPLNEATQRAGKAEPKEGT